MTSGFGVDATDDGLSGTSSEDIRKILGGLYSPGVITGCDVTTSASTMEYTVASGVVAISAATGEIILAPVPQTVVMAPAAPISGSRTDIVYVKQRYPSIVGEGDAEIVLGVAEVLPERALALQKFTVGSGIANTKAATSLNSVDFSIPYGTNGKNYYDYTYSVSGALPNPLTRVGGGSIYLATDRKLRFTLSATLQSIGAVGFDNAKYCEYYFLPNIDNGDIMIWQTPGLHQSLATYYFEGFYNATKGRHSVNLGMGRMVGPGTAQTQHGLVGGFGRTGIVFNIRDAGPIV